MKPVSSRISFAGVLVCVLSLLLPVAIADWQSRSRQRRQNGPTEQPFSPTLSGPELASESERAAMEAQNQFELRMDVQRLYALATELKDEVDGTNTNQVLSVSVLKRTQEIEKLAKQIRDRAKR